MSEAERLTVRAWQYEDVDEDTSIVDRPGHDCFAVLSGNDVVGYCAFGRFAMVPPYLDEDGCVGVAWGLRPDSLGGGNGARFITAIATFGAERYRPRKVQAVIKQRNGRSLRAAERAGFTRVDDVKGRAILWWLRDTTADQA